ncbi:MAG: hypothetical protein DRO04_02045 [Candidatus Iainarchaeum archaeon]|uniref:Uncharacterized protein n=1 Tax=Candidatus Iainarchaeum sp. TaxID=3101447 RepID=A0A497JK11_9ARCH|nr:MAG: hypothetical protein DRO04_02045 [Candidatus Diapherotrites archaeon]
MFEDILAAVNIQILEAAAALIVGIIIGKLSNRLTVLLAKKFEFRDMKSVRSFARLLEWFFLILAVVIALSFLGVDAASAIVKNLVSLLPPIVTLILLLFLGVIIANLFVDVLSGLFYKLGMADYLYALGFDKSIISSAFTAIKFLFYLIVFTSSLNYVGLTLAYLDILIHGIIYAVIVLATAFIFFSFKDPAANFFAAMYIQKNIFKAGQNVKIGNIEGDVIAITNHATVIRTPQGYNAYIPNKDILHKVVFVKRARAELKSLEEIRKNYVAQKPSYCGPASASMMLSLFGYNFDQDTIAKKAKTSVPGGTLPKNLINAVEELTSKNVIGRLIMYDKIYNLKEEVKSWLADQALVILWFKKPVIFPGSKTGHYVLCVGVEKNELIVMDPNVEKGGVYLVDYRLMEEAMSFQQDKARGYLVFAKKGTAAYWRIKQNLLYFNTAAYKELSKSLENYLLRIMRKSRALKEILSPLVKERMEAVTHLWKPTAE